MAACSMPKPNVSEQGEVQAFETEGLIGTDSRAGGAWLISFTASRLGSTAGLRC